MIAINNISKKYGRNKVLKGISAEIKTGAITAFLGPNGSGKTTLLKTILGLVRPIKGEVLVDGASILNKSEYRKKIGYMAQIANYPDNLSANELFKMVSELRKQEPVFSEILIEKFTLKDFLNKPLKNLSGGTKQKVNAVMALMFDVPVLILDEPTVGLDPESSRIFKQFLIERKNSGATILFSSHIMYDIEELADEVMILLEGNMIFNGNISELKSGTGSQGIEEALVEIARKSRMQNDV
jgi:Cu-processing system ATP-binding protein